jgi:Spy/CpxP family protein refolding chaperone
VVISPKLRIYAIVLGIFVLGAGAGGAAGYAMASKRIAEAFRDDRPGLGDARRFEALSHELDLTRDQRKQVRAIMERHREENRALTRAMVERCGDDLQALRDKVDAEIRGVLDPQQQQRFKVLMDERGQRFPLGRPGPRRHKDKD